MGKKAVITLHPRFRVGEISPRLFGAFLEPIGTLVNGMMYNPKHPTADENGFRRDVIDSLKESGLPAVRLPGGNFISGWDWKDSIGPKEERKVHLDTAWHQYYTNEVGHDEYLQWAEKIGTEPLYTINLGTGDLNDAVYITEYTNHEGGTYWSDLRRKNGHEKPYDVKLWYLGNEMDGPWQIGSWENDPRGYGVRANEVSKAMKWVDGRIETAACVSCSPLLHHYPSWEEQVLEQCYETVDYISMHYYHVAKPDDFCGLLGGTIYYEDYINTEIALCDFMATKLRSNKKMMLSFDEFGSHFRPASEPRIGYNPRANLHNSFYSFNPNATYVRHDPDNMYNRRRFGSQGDMIGALANTAPQLSFIRHADRVKVGCMTGGLGAITATNRENVWRSGSFYPYLHLIKYARGTSMMVDVDSETFDIPAYFIDDGTQYQTREGLSYLDAAAALDDETGELNVFVINRKWDASMGAEIDLTAFGDMEFVEHIELYTDDRTARNTFEDGEAVKPKINLESKFADGKLAADMKPLSWNVFRFKKV